MGKICGGGIYDTDERWYGSTILYHYFTEDGDLLYIGISNQVESRDRAHWVKDKWRCDAAYMHCQLFPTRELAELAECLAIDKLDPEHNIRRWGAGGVYYCDRWYAPDPSKPLLGVNPTWVSVHVGWPFEWPKVCDAPWPDRDDLRMWDGHGWYYGFGDDPRRSVNGP
jgi:hypothetical protein